MTPTHKSTELDTAEHAELNKSLATFWHREAQTLLEQQNILYAQLGTLKLEHEATLERLKKAEFYAECYLSMNGRTLDKVLGL